MPCSPEQHFQLSSSNTTQTIEKLFAQYWGELQPNTSTGLYISHCLLLATTYHIPTKAQDSTPALNPGADL